MNNKMNPIEREARQAVFWKTFSLVFLVVVWETMGQLKITLAVPPLSEVFLAWFQMILSGEMLAALFISVQTLFLGFLLAVVLGIGTGLLAGRYPMVEYSIRFLINFFMSAPMVATIPIIMLIFGIDFSSRVIITFLFGYFVIAVNTITGVQSVDRTLVEMARSYCTPEGKIFFKSMLPGAIPEILTGIRLGLGRSILGTVVSEMLMALTGLGAKISYYGNAFVSDRMLAVALTIMIIAILLRTLMGGFERRVARWKYRA